MLPLLVDGMMKAAKAAFVDFGLLSFQESIQETEKQLKLA